MGNKSVRFNCKNQPQSSKAFISARKKNEKSEYPKEFEMSSSDNTENEDSVSIKYSESPSDPSSLTECFIDSDDLPERKVKIKRNFDRYKSRTSKKSLEFKFKRSQFERYEHTYAKTFIEKNVKFNADIKEDESSLQFKIKAKSFDKNESRVCVLVNNSDMLKVKNNALNHDRSKSNEINYRRKSFDYKYEVDYLYD